MTEKGVLVSLNLKSKGISNISGSFDLEVKIIMPTLFYDAGYWQVFKHFPEAFRAIIQKDYNLGVSAISNSFNKFSLNS